MAGCASRSCIDVYDPVKVRRLKEWAESDAKFLRRLSRMTKEHHHHQEHSALLSAPAYFSSSTERSDSLQERFAGRQRFLRSYTFGQEKEKHTTVFLQIIKQLWLKMKKMRKGKGKGKRKKNRDSSCSLWKGCVQFLLSCAAKVDVLSEESISITGKS